MKSFLVLALISFSAFASDIDKRPPSFAFSSGKAVFVDYTNANYNITYDINKGIAFAEAEMTFISAENGFPIFDSHAEPTFVSIDGIATSQTLMATPSNETKVRVVTKEIQPGSHTLKVSLPITQLVEFANQNVKSAFWMTDLTDRGYLERYLPTNVLFDRIPMQFHVKFIGAKSKQKVYANGDITVISDSEVKISFRSGLNANCIYFHTMPETAVLETAFSYKSLDGRNLPSVVYMMRDGTDLSSKLEDQKRRVITIMDELEGDYGPFPHPSLTVYIAGSGGMEYSGATMTSPGALGHELYHSYFARAVLHADGNSGWIDEALASWRDNGYDRITSLAGTTTMASKPLYTRLTDRQAYSFGERFFSLMDGKLQNKGGLKPFLREMIENHTFVPLTTEEFIKLMEQFYSQSFTADFKKYVYGQNKDFSKGMIESSKRPHAIHKQLTLEELRNFL